MVLRGGGEGRVIGNISVVILVTWTGLVWWLWSESFYPCVHNKTVNIAATERSDFSLGAFISFRSAAHLEVFLLENVVLIGPRLRSWKHITEKYTHLNLESIKYKFTQRPGWSLGKTTNDQTRTLETRKARDACIDYSEICCTHLFKIRGKWRTLAKGLRRCGTPLENTIIQSELSLKVFAKLWHASQIYLNSSAGTLKLSQLSGKLPRCFKPLSCVVGGFIASVSSFGRYLDTVSVFSQTFWTHLDCFAERLKWSLFCCRRLQTKSQIVNCSVSSLRHTDKQLKWVKPTKAPVHR